MMLHMGKNHLVHQSGVVSEDDDRSCELLCSRIECNIFEKTLCVFGKEPVLLFELLVLFVVLNFAL